jgi:hypothetical protein
MTLQRHGNQIDESGETTRTSQGGPSMLVMWQMIREKRWRPCLASAAGFFTELRTYNPEVRLRALLSLLENVDASPMRPLADGRDLLVLDRG